MSFPEDWFTVAVASRTGLGRAAVYDWRLVFGERYANEVSVVTRTIQTYMERGVPRAYVRALSKEYRGSLNTVEEAVGVCRLHAAGVLPKYVAESQMDNAGNILRLATAGVPFEYIRPEQRPSEFPSVLVMLHRANVPHDYAKFLLDAGYTVEDTIGAWASGLPAEYAVAVTGA